MVTTTPPLSARSKNLQSTFMESLGDSLVFLVVLRAIGLILLVALITAFFFVGGRKNVDWRIVRELTRTWRCYVIAVAVVGNVVVDYVCPTPDFSKVHEIDTLVFALCKADALLACLLFFLFISHGQPTQLKTSLLNRHVLVRDPGCYNLPFENLPDPLNVRRCRWGAIFVF